MTGSDVPPRLATSWCSTVDVSAVPFATRDVAGKGIPESRWVTGTIPPPAGHAANFAGAEDDQSGMRRQNGVGQCAYAFNNPVNC